MKLVTFIFHQGQSQAGVVYGQRIIPLAYPSVLELLQDPLGLQKARELSASASESYQIDICLHSNEREAFAPRGAFLNAYGYEEVTLLAPIPEPPSVRDFYAFEQHVRTARAKRGLEMIPDWYEIPIFYFTNPAEIYGYNQDIPYPSDTKELDFELEIACVIGREGKDIAVEDAADYIAGYTIMNDWSARDFQLRDMKLNLGPGKGKDFATSLGPWLVTPDELASRRTGSAASERYDMTMRARINGQEISRGNFNQIFYSFPQMLAWASKNARVRVGDVLGSGTVGTGCLLEIGTEVHPWLQRADVAELEIEGIGILRNRIV